MTQLILLLPGLDGTGRLFARFLSRLAATAPVEVMAYPPDPRQTLEDLAGLVEAQIGRRTATVIAESFSGPAIPPPRAVIRATMLNGCDDPGLLAELMAVVRAIPPAVMAARLRIMAGLRAQDLRCDVPVLAIQALRDRIVPARALDSLRRACPRIEERSIDGPHLLLQAEPQTCLELLGPFIA
jgi:pimeloyl-[acyl-carrier protein] methyl ester esterase